MSTLWQEFDDAKTEQIYQATLELVLKQGLSGLKMADVAAQAGLATGTVYIYFKDKDELINHLYAHLKAKVILLSPENRKKMSRSKVFTQDLEAIFYIQVSAFA